MIAPALATDTGLKLRLLPVGSGQAMALLEKGEVDAAITHDPEGEQAFVARDTAWRRAPIMSNRFLVIGPEKDPAGVRGKDVAEAFRLLRRAPFVSRGDDSGTHRAEKRFWSLAGGPHAGEGYRETGQGMGETLGVADELLAYTLTDSATLAAYAGKLDLVPLVEGDPRLLNHYSILWKDPSPAAERLATWLRSDRAKALMPPGFDPAP